MGKAILKGFSCSAACGERGGGGRSTGAFRDRRSGGDGGSATGARCALKHDTIMEGRAARAHQHVARLVVRVVQPAVPLRAHLRGVVRRTRHAQSRATPGQAVPSGSSAWATGCAPCSHRSSARWPRCPWAWGTRPSACARTARSCPRSTCCRCSPCQRTSPCEACFPSLSCCTRRQSPRRA
jgi:hypothetical protein